MILLPIGHEESTVRRLPVITFGIMALCLLLLVLPGQDGSDVEMELAERGVEAFQYYWEHPYLELDDEFETAVAGAPDAIENEYAEIADAFEGLHDRPESEAALAAEQAEMDRLIAAVLDARERHAFFRWGLVPADFSLVGLFTHMFMHAGWLHLIGNLLILYLLGPFIEDVWGRPLYACLYLVSGVVAAAAHLASNAGSEVPMVGASGAIAGVMGAFLVHYHRTKIKFFFAIGFFIRGTFDSPAWIMLPLWFGEQLMLALLLGDELSGVAYWAHVGGFVCGLVGALSVRRAGILERFVAPQLDQRTGTALLDRPGLDRALAAYGEERYEEAYELLTAELRSEPHNVDAAELYWETATRLERQAEALPWMLRSVQAQVRHGETAAVCALWERMVEADPTLRADPQFLVRLTRLQLEQNRHDEAQATLRRALLSVGAVPAAGLALKIAKLGQRLDPAIARATLVPLSKRADLSVEERAAAEALLAQIAVAPARVEPQAGPSRSALSEEEEEPIPLALD